jgi:hypothetical protein
MNAQKIKKPDFLIIGAQKCGTTWLWRMLEQHPQTALPQKKEIHYFGGSENYHKGKQWYYDHFTNLDETKITGEASTTYLFDEVPFWYNPSRNLKMDDSLPSIPDLIKAELPDVKLIAILRNPVNRAISAYNHLMRRVVIKKRSYDEGISPALKIETVARSFPKNRILEYGFYSKYLKRWFATIPKERFKIFIFEEDLLKTPSKMVFNAYQFLGLAPDFKPEFPQKTFNKSWGRTRIVALYYMPNWLKSPVMNRGLNFLDKYDFLKKSYIRQRDIDFLKDAYQNEKKDLEELLDRPIPWNI